MKTATVNQLKQELTYRSQAELVELCLRLSKFKKENKELLTYLLYEATNEASYIKNVKNEIDLLFGQINTASVYYIKKSVRKILRETKKYIRYSKKKETEVELLMFFCEKLRNLKPSINKSVAMLNIYHRQIEATKKAISYLHEDLQYDYENELIAIMDSE